MAQSQYEDLFNESEELLKQMSHILESLPRRLPLIGIRVKKEN